MKRLLVISLGILVLSCSKESETKYSVDSEKVYLLITENTTKDELTKIAIDFKRGKNIIIDFSETEFSENGKIENLVLDVDCNDGFRGKALSTGKLLKIKNSGFSRDYTKGAKNPFIVGAM